MSIYRLPTIEMVGGETHTISINITNTCFQEPASSITANLYVSHYINDEDDPIFIENTSTNDGHGNITFILKKENTINLHGKYVYQIHLTNGTKSEFYNGFMIIYKNRNKGGVSV